MYVCLCTTGSSRQSCPIGCQTVATKGAREKATGMASKGKVWAPKHLHRISAEQLLIETHSSPTAAKDGTSSTASDTKCSVQPNPVLALLRLCETHCALLSISNAVTIYALVYIKKQVLILEHTFTVHSISIIRTYRIQSKTLWNSFMKWKSINVIKAKWLFLIVSQSISISVAIIIKWKPCEYYQLSTLRFNCSAKILNMHYIVISQYV